MKIAILIFRFFCIDLEDALLWSELFTVHDYPSSAAILFNAPDNTCYEVKPSDAASAAMELVKVIHNDDSPPVRFHDENDDGNDYYLMKVWWLSQEMHVYVIIGQLSYNKFLQGDN